MHRCLSVFEMKTRNERYGLLKGGNDEEETISRSDGSACYFGLW